MKLTVLLLCFAVCAVHGLKENNELESKKENELLSGIEGGKKIAIAKRPYTASIHTIKFGKKFLGTGVILSKDWVLTAAINLETRIPSEVAVRVGSNHALEGGIDHEVTQVVVHPSYEGNWKHNLGLVKVKHHIKFGKLSKPILLAASLPKDGAKAIVTGYGSINSEVTTDLILREAKVPFISFNMCKKVYKPSVSTSFSDLSFCASKEGVSPCPLDWGAPLIHNHHLIGIFSGNIGTCGSVKSPAVYVDLTKFRKWIKNTIRN